MPNDKDKVSDTQGGIYFFSLRFPSNYELGIRRKTIEDVMVNINRFLDLYDNINNSNKFQGCISDDKAEHLKILQETNIFQKSAIQPSQLLSAIDITNKTDLEELIEILRMSLQFSNPIYVGLAGKQSLRQRLEQHLTGASSMKKFMEIHQLTWNKIQYNCFPVENLIILRKIEKLIQNLSKPKFSTV